jgi:exopolysaccharide production protein ExoZ
MNTTLHSIQYLRGIAAFLIVLVHLPLQLERMGYAGHWPSWLNIGVDIFFVISGFIMWTSTHGTAVTPMQFLQRRLVRIVPLYWLLTAGTVVLLALAPSLLQSGKFELAHIVKSFLFIAAEHPVTHRMEPVLVPGWTLNLEMFFYVVFALCLALPAQFRTGMTILVLVAITACRGFFPGQDSLGAFYTSGMILEFVYGIALGVAYTRWTTVPRISPMVLAGLVCVCVVSAVILLASDLPREIRYGVPSLMLVAGGLAAERCGRMVHNRLLHTIGDASYSLYLTHGIVLSMIGQAWRKVGAASLPFSHLLFTVVAVVIVTIIAIGVYRWIERPMGLMLRGVGRGARVGTLSRV